MSVLESLRYLIELLKDALMMVGSNPNAKILNLHDGLCLLFGNGNPDLVCQRRIFHGIGEQIDEDLSNPCFIGIYRNAVLAGSDNPVGLCPFLDIVYHLLNKAIQTY